LLSVLQFALATLSDDEQPHGALTTQFGASEEIFIGIVLGFGGEIRLHSDFSMLGFALR
jgi:hypothetical protein